ncbi:MAG: ATP-dependent helicase HrpB [Elusimicrobia bacterium]|nr:ATP-dependent helicase HrpB [Elusimicrobiota bacterium]
MSTPLPIAAHRETIVAELERAGALVLTAPTGSGKSTQVPQFLRGRVKGKILVLEPRRLSTRSLAARVASETKTALGGEIGYQVRFDSRVGPKTQVIFQTYGLFVSRMMGEPDLPGVGAVLLDEFHERTLECDLALAWLKVLRRTRPELKVVVMSATLESAAVRRYWPQAAALDVPGRMFPVDIRHQPVAAKDGAIDGALQALRDLSREGLNGSVLVFMPGLREIRRALTVLGPFCREQGLDLRQLHGSMDLDEQQAVLEPGEKHRVIVTTNVAETGLTVPGVTMVIDSGLHRVAAYDATRGINTLYLSRISRANADQRAGRAGRTAPGRCVRLWTRAEEAGMAESLKPEMARLELSSLFLQAACLPAKLEWLTPPPPIAWSAAMSLLRSLSAIDDDGHITPVGRALAKYPAPPRVAAVLEGAKALGPSAYEKACAMAAVFETAGDRPPSSPADLDGLAGDLMYGGRGELPWEANEVFRQFKRMNETNGISGQEGSPDSLPRLWVDAFLDRLAARAGDGVYYRLPDGRGATLPVKDLPQAILALEVRERAGGGQAKQVNVSLYLPLKVEQLQRMYPGECVWEPWSGFDEKKQRVTKEERLMFRGLVLDRKETNAERSDKKAAAEIWAEKYATGELRHPGLDEKVEQLVTRIALARQLYPDLGYPEMTADDWRLIYGEAFHGKNNVKDIERVELVRPVEDYLGPMLKPHLDRVLPTHRKLPSGKNGRFTYFLPARAELNARLGDFVKMTGALALCEGRLPVTFDILAPNYRTVQKTTDLASFWANAYPTIKKELQRRYPRHPWP